MARRRAVCLGFRSCSCFRLQSPEGLCSCIGPLVRRSGVACVFFSRVRRIASFPSVVGDLGLGPAISLCIANSGTCVLSDRVTALLSNECMRVTVLPLSFGRCTRNVNNASRLPRACVRCIDGDDFPCALRLSATGRVDSCLGTICGAVIMGSVVDQGGLSSIVVLRDIVHFATSGVNGVLSAGHVTSLVSTSKQGVSRGAIRGCLSALYRSFFLCRIGQCGVGNGRLLGALKGCCLISVNLQHVLLNSHSFSTKHVLRGVIFLRLLHQRGGICVNGVSGLRISFITVSRGSLACCRMTTAMESRGALGHRLTSLRRVGSRCPGCVLALSRSPATSCSNVGQVGTLG